MFSIIGIGRAAIATLAIAALVIFISRDGSFPRGTEVSSYSVSGETFAEVLSRLKEEGPKDQYGIARYAVTKWSLRWGVNREENKPEVSKSIKVVLPDWRDKATASKEMQKEWNRFYQAIVSHEQQHAHRASQTARTIESEIQRLLDSKPKVSLEEINRVANKFIRENQEWDLEFDKKTRHGREEGVVLNSPNIP